MDHELHTLPPVVRPVIDSQERRKRFKTIFSKIRKISTKQWIEPMPPHQFVHDIEPIKLGLRVVFRGQGRLPAERLVALHKLIKTESSLASEALNVVIEGVQKKLQEIDLHCAIRHRFEERLKVTAQLSSLIAPDPEFIKLTQEVFEQFFLAHGIPNEVESNLLQRMARVDAETIDAWFTLKVFRLRGYLTLVLDFRSKILARYPKPLKTTVSKSYLLH